MLEIFLNRHYIMYIFRAVLLIYIFKAYSCITVVLPLGRVWEQAILIVLVRVTWGVVNNVSSNTLSGSSR